MKSSLITTLTLAALAIGVSAPISAEPIYPEDGYEAYEVPLFWQKMGKKGAPSKLFELETNNKASKELERDEVYFLDLPEAPRTGKLYVRFNATGEAPADISAAPIIQIYGATLCYAMVPTNESDPQVLKKATYAFVEAENKGEANWVKTGERRFKKSRSGTDEERRQKSWDRFLTTHQFSIEIDFDQQTWRPTSQSEDISYPLLKEKGKKLILIRKQEEVDAYVSNLVISETRYSRVGGPKRPIGMSKEDWEEKLRQENEGRMQGVAAEIRRRREERSNSSNQ